MTQPMILNIHMVPAGVDLVVEALGKLPYEQAAPLIDEIKGQALYQIQQIKDTQEKQLEFDFANEKVRDE